jgi:hypothetical protein
LRYKLYPRIMKIENAMSTIRIHVHNWPEESVVRYISYVERTARGSAENEVYDRMTCPLLWSINVARCLIANGLYQHYRQSPRSRSWVLFLLTTNPASDWARL